MTVSEADWTAADTPLNATLSESASGLKWVPRTVTIVFGDAVDGTMLEMMGAVDVGGTGVTGGMLGVVASFFWQEHHKAIKTQIYESRIGQI
jgi:hypothetical protein